MHRFLGTAGMAYLLEPCGEGPELVRKQEEEGRVKSRVFTRVSPGRNGRGEVQGVSLGLDNLNNFGRLWAIGVVLPVQYLALG